MAYIWPTFSFLACFPVGWAERKAPGRKQQPFGTQTHFSGSAESSYWHEAATKPTSSLLFPGSSFGPFNTTARCLCSAVWHRASLLQNTLDTKVRGDKNWRSFPGHPVRLQLMLEGSTLLLISPTWHSSSLPDYLHSGLQVSTLDMETIALQRLLNQLSQLCQAYSL